MGLASANKAAIADAALPADLGGIDTFAGYTAQITVSRNLTLGHLNKSNSGTLSIDADVTLVSRGGWLGNGEVVGAGTFKVGDAGGLGVMELNGPVVLGVSQFVISSDSQLTISDDLTFSGEYRANGNLVNNGKLIWEDGDIDETIDVAPVNYIIVNNGTLTITAEASELYFGEIQNSGLVVVSLPAQQNEVTIWSLSNNAPGGVLTEGNESFAGVGLGVLKGVLKCTANSSEVEVHVSQGAVFEPESFDAKEGASFTGAGKVRVTGGLEVFEDTTLSVAPTLELARFATISGSQGNDGTFGILHVSGLFKVTAYDGELTNVDLYADYAVNFEMGGDEEVHLKLTNSSLTMHGGVWNSGNVILIGSTITNTGSFEIKTDDDVIMDMAPATFWNAAGATITKTAGNGVTEFRVPVFTSGDVLLNGRKMHFSKNLTQSAGVIDLGGGILDLNRTVDNPGPGAYWLTGGRLKGSGSITNGNLENSGTVDVLNTLSLGGNYRQYSGGTLRISAAADNALSLLDVSGSALLAGALEIEVGSYDFDFGIVHSIIRMGVALELNVSSAFDSTPPFWGGDYLPNSVDVWVYVD